MGLGVTWWYRVTIFGWLVAPANERLSPHEGLPVYTGLTEVFGATLWLMMRVGFFFAIPAGSLTLFYLVRPLLNEQQRRAVALFIPAIFLCFLIGASFAYWVMLPVGIGFLLDFGEGIAVPTIRISEYLNLTSAMIFWLGVIFEIPLLMFLLARLGMISHGGFKRVRKFVPPSASIFGAILSPGFDIVTALLIAIPIVVLYEVGLLLAWLAIPGKGSLVLRRIKMVLLEILRRLTIIVLIAVPVLPILHLLYAVGSMLSDVFYGDLATDRRKPWVERAHARMRRELAGLARLRRKRNPYYVTDKQGTPNCIEETAPRG